MLYFRNNIIIENMDSTEDLEHWISQPDVCRCCLSDTGTRDVTAAYINDGGSKEVYSDMLKECYGITLSYLVEWGPSRMVCGVCVEHLRDADNFRQRVLQAEVQFVEYYRNRKDIVLHEAKIKTELEIEMQDGSANSYDENGDGSTEFLDEEFLEEKEIIKSELMSQDETNALDTIEKSFDEIISTNSIKEPVKRKRGRPRKYDVNTIKNKTSQNTKVNKAKKLKKSKLESMDESDSDTVAQLMDNVPYSDDNNVEIEIEAVSTGPKRRGREHTAIPNTEKQVSERKRVMLTCDTVLRDTTACPFRHHKSWFQCFFCQQDFMEINLLRTHTINDHPNIDEEIKKIKRYPRSLQIEISNLECRHCHLNLTDLTSMRRHFAERHKKVIYIECIADYKVDSSPYSCHLCGKQFHVFRTLTTHLNVHYANCICDVCGKSFLNSKRLKVHKRTHESGHFPCTECGKVLKTKTSKANHMESAHSKRIIKCQICFKPMKHYNDRIKHMSEVHNITHKFQCPICGREYNIKHYLATHIRQTHGHKNKKCSDCGMAFITNHGLKKHMLRHTGAKPFTCSVCCKTYARSYTLREHMRAHEGERRYVGTE